MTVGLLHHGETVVWASAGRSAATRERARVGGFEDAGEVSELRSRADLVVSLCPPHAALEVARSFAGFDGIYVDANAVSPATARTIAGLVGRYVDGGVIGPPPRERGTTRLYLSGPEAGTVAALFAGTPLDARVVSAEPGAASAVKVAFAAWSKGTAALLLAIHALARAEGVEGTLEEEWRLSLPHLDEQSAAAARSALRKGWRWIGEMEEIAQSLGAAGLPAGFHEAAAEVYRRAADGKGSDLLRRAVAELAGEEPG